MAAVMIVEVQPARKGGGASRLAAVDADVGPLLEQGAVEALDLAVGLGVVGPGAARPDASGQAGPLEGVAAVARAVVGEHGPPADPVLVEPGSRPPPERDRGDRALVGQHLAVGEAGVVVDGGMDEGVADPAVAVVRVAAAAVCSPATAWGDAAQLLDVDVDEVAGRGVLVAAADHLPGGAVEPGKAVESEPAEHTVDRRGGHVQLRGDARGTELAAAPQPIDPTLDAGRHLGGAASRTARSVAEAGFALGEPAAPPLVRGLAGDAHLGGDMRRGAAARDALDEDAATGGGEFGVRVHVSLLGTGATGRTATPSLGGSPHARTPTRVTNVRGGHT